MIHLLDMENSGYDLISLPEILPDARGHSCPNCGNQRCNHCGQGDAFHPEPQLSGNLQVDLTKNTWYQFIESILGWPELLPPSLHQGKHTSDAVSSYPLELAA